MTDTDRSICDALSKWWNPPDFVLRQAGADATAGLDMAGSEPQAFHTKVLCPEGHDVPAGSTCPHTCKPGSCDGCPMVKG